MMDESSEESSVNILLYDEGNHISSQLQQGEEVESVRLIAVESKSNLWKLNPKMQEYVQRTGLHHLAELKKGKIDHALINALIESYISAQDLYLVLRRHWISTTIMDYWLSTSAGRFRGVHIFPSTLATMRDRGWNSACSVAFSLCHSHQMDEFDEFIFPVWHHSHFFLIVAYPRYKRWDYYNTIGWRKRHWEYAQGFKLFICTEFSSRGWEAGGWEMHNVASCPQQGNSDDCGVFVMAIADHLARRRELGFTQADMWYFRQKIVHDIYHRQSKNAAGQNAIPSTSSV